MGVSLHLGGNGGVRAHVFFGGGPVYVGGGWCAPEPGPWQGGGVVGIPFGPPRPVVFVEPRPVPRYEPPVYEQGPPNPYYGQNTVPSYATPPETVAPTVAAPAQPSAAYYTPPAGPTAPAAVTASPDASGSAQQNSQTGYDPFKAADALNAMNNRLHFEVDSNGNLTTKLPNSGGGLNTSLHTDSTLKDKLFNNFTVVGDTLVSNGPLTAGDIATFQRNTAAIKEAVSGHPDETGTRNGISGAERYYNESIGVDVIERLNSAADSRLKFQVHTINGVAAGVEADFFKASNPHPNSDPQPTLDPNSPIVKQLLNDSNMHVEGDKIVSNGARMSSQDILNFQRNAPAWREAVSGHIEGPYGAIDLYTKIHAADGMGAPVQGLAPQAPRQAAGQLTRPPGPVQTSTLSLDSLTHQELVSGMQVIAKTLYDQGLISTDPTKHNGISGIEDKDTHKAIVEIRRLLNVDDTNPLINKGLDVETMEAAIRKEQELKKLPVVNGKLDSATIHSVILNERDYERDGLGVKIKNEEAFTAYANGLAEAKPLQTPKVVSNNPQQGGLQVG